MPALAMAEQQSSHEHYMYMCNFLGVEPSESYLKKQDYGPAKVQVLVYADNCQPPATDVNRLHRQQQQERWRQSHSSQEQKPKQQQRKNDLQRESSSPKTPRVSKEAVPTDKKQQQPIITRKPITSRPSTSRPSTGLKPSSARRVPSVAVQQGSNCPTSAPVAKTTGMSSPAPASAKMTPKRAAAAAAPAPLTLAPQAAAAATGSAPAPLPEHRPSSTPSPRLQHTRVSCNTARACDRRTESQVPLSPRAVQVQVTTQVPAKPGHSVSTDAASTQQQQQGSKQQPPFKQQAGEQQGKADPQHHGDFQKQDAAQKLSTHMHEQPAAPAELLLQQQRAREEEQRRDAKAASIALQYSRNFKYPTGNGVACCESREINSITRASGLASGPVGHAGVTDSTTGTNSVNYTKQSMHTSAAGSATSGSLQAPQGQTITGATSGTSATPAEAAAAAASSGAVLADNRTFRPPQMWLPPIRERHPYEEDRYIRELAVYEAAREAQHMRAVAEMLTKAAAMSHQHHQQQQMQQKQQQQGVAACGSDSLKFEGHSFQKLRGGVGQQGAKYAAADDGRAEADSAAEAVTAVVGDCRSFRDLLRKSSKKLKKLVKSLSGKKKAVRPVGAASI